MAYVINVYGGFVFIDPVNDAMAPDSIGVIAIEFTR
jgi:hypothetical protein